MYRVFECGVMFGPVKVAGRAGVKASGLSLTLRAMRIMQRRHCNSHVTATASNDRTVPDRFERATLDNLRIEPAVLVLLRQ